mmetsp:Transcript_3219/g.5261  ORF Transcript_3219/g.5261 Transcript_3219/m.5261 type:complete len:267 (+) Transcript_3219:2088-2888(+)
MALAWSGISGRDQASGAGDKSSVLVSPVTLKTVVVYFSGAAGLEVNHSAAAQLSITALACLFPFFIFSSTSWKASNIRIVLERPAAAAGANSSSSRALIKGVTLYPPIIVPSISTAATLETRGEVASPLTMAAKNAALTYEPSSTPGGTRFFNKSKANSPSPAGGFLSMSTTADVHFAFNGSGTMPSDSRSATCASYSVLKADANARRGIAIILKLPFCARRSTANLVDWRDMAGAKRDMAGIVTVPWLPTTGVMQGGCGRAVAAH